MSMPLEEQLPGEEQIAFLDDIWGEDSGFVQVIQKQLDANGMRTGEPKDGKFFRWPMERDRIGRFVESRLDEDLYFAVPQYKTTQRRASEVKTLKAVYVDDDGVTGNWLIEPSYTIETSPGHKHVYWVLDKGYDPVEVSRIGFDISAYHRHDNEFHADMIANHKHCGTDPGGWDLSQILRVPGSLNTKATLPAAFRSEVLKDTGKVYTLKELQGVYPHSDQPFIAAVSTDELPADIPDHLSLLAQLGSRADLIDLFTTEPTGIGNAQGWDERLFALENELFRLGFTPQEVYAIAWHSACNKFKRGVRNSDGITFSPRPNPQLDLWRDVVKAGIVHSQREVGFDSSEYDFGSTVDEEATDAVDAPRTFLSARKNIEIDLLHDNEKDRIMGLVTFVDEYVDWASSKTDAAEVYHEACAFTILSTVYGEYGHAFPRFGKLRLNLWFLVMGKTTRSRKSTSRGLMMKVIDGISTHDYKYDEGSDFTAEGLSNALLEKPRQSSLVHRDEVQGMFKEIGTKNYMAGLNDFLTELYDGVVRGKKRATGAVKSSDKVEANFILFLMGIVSKITSVLTLEDFQSGFLARFIHVIGESPERTRESEWLDQASPSEVASGDPAYIRLVGSLVKTRAKWAKIAPERETVPILFEEDAWQRWNEANWDLGEYIQDHDRKDVLEPAFDRMGKSAIKAAALLAMSEGRNRVNLDDVLVALKYVSVWATHTIRSAEMVSESFWKKDMNTLHDLVLRKGGSMKWEDAYKGMDKQPGEFKNLVEGCVLSDMIRVRVDVTSPAKTRWLEAM